MQILLRYCQLHDTLNSPVASSSGQQHGRASHETQDNEEEEEEEEEDDDDANAEVHLTRRGGYAGGAPSVCLAAQRASGCVCVWVSS